MIRIGIAGSVRCRTIPSGSRVHGRVLADAAKNTPGAVIRYPEPMASDEATSHSKQVHFQDPRSPFDVQVQLERDWRIVFHPVAREPRLTLRAKDRGDVPVVFHFCFEAAPPKLNYYSLTMEVSWAHQPPVSHEHYRKACATWFDPWTNDLKLCAAPKPGEGSEERYKALADAAWSAEAHLVDVPALQREIVSAVRGGAAFIQHHKEGGAAIWFERGRFAYGTYGDVNSAQTYPDDAMFLDFLRQCFHVEMDAAGEFNAWKQVLRQFKYDKRPAAKQSLLKHVWDALR